MFTRRYALESAAEGTFHVRLLFCQTLKHSTVMLIGFEQGFSELLLTLSAPHRSYDQHLPISGYFQRRLRVDLQKVEFMDSSGLGVLVGGLKRVKSHQGSVTLVCTQENILKIFRITGLVKVFPIFSSQDEAVKNIKSGAA